MANKDFKKIAKKFRGKRFSEADKKAIFERCRDLIKEGVAPDVAVTIMNAEGFRRVDGSLVTASWVNSQFNKVREAYKDKKVRKGSGPVKEIYRAGHLRGGVSEPWGTAEAKSKAIQNRAEKDAIDLAVGVIVGSSLPSDVKVMAVKILLGN